MTALTPNRIHPTAIIEPGAELGAGNHIGPFCYLGPRVQIGDGNRLEAYVSVGTPPEDLPHLTDHRYGVIIGNDCTIREFATVHSGSDRPTVLRNRVLLLTKSHVGHDGFLEDDVTISAATVLAGRVHVMRWANVGLAAAVHQHQVIGAGAMIGANGAVARKSRIEPFGTYAGVPVQRIATNHVGLERHRVTEAEIEALTTVFDQLRDSEHWLVDRT